MAADRDAPMYNLKVVVQETGIKPDTLRAWERRYGLPIPVRSEGGHRLYSQHDIDMLRWLVTRQEEGLSISRAVNLWLELEKEGQDPLEVEPLESEETAFQPVSISVAGDAISRFREEWIKACLGFNEGQAHSLVVQALGLYPPETVAHEIIQKGLSQIGHLWYEGQASVQQEHFASELAMRRIEAMLASAPPPTRPERVMVGCPPGEHHSFPALLISLSLRRQGYDVVTLGANVPGEQLAETIQQTRPGLVILSAQRLPTAATLQDLALVAQDLGVNLAFGGLIFNRIPDLVRRVPGFYLGDDLAGIPAHIDELLRADPADVGYDPPSGGYQNTYKSFERMRPLIEASVWQQFVFDQRISAYNLKTANDHLNDNIAAALKLGDISLLGPDIDWITDLLGHHQLSDQALRIYLAAYQEAVSEIMGEEGMIIVRWFEDVLN